MQCIAGQQLGLANYSHAGGDFLGAVLGAAYIFRSTKRFTEPEDPNQDPSLETTRK